jgi:hypothetical protein
MRRNVAFEADIKECIADMLLESVNEDRTRLVKIWNLHADLCAYTLNLWKKNEDLPFDKRRLRNKGVFLKSDHDPVRRVALLKNFVIDRFP